MRTPTQYEVPLRSERQERETVRDSRKRREDHTGRQMLKVWDDAFLTLLSAVIKHVVAVPTRATACAHVSQPRPDIACGSIDGDGVSEGGERLGDEVVARQRLQPLDRRRANGSRSRARSGCGGALRLASDCAEEPPTDERAKWLDDLPVPGEPAFCDRRERERGVLEH